MARKPTQSDDAQTETVRDVYGALSDDDVEAREDWDPALEPEGLVPETAEDGRKFSVAAWDGGVSDLRGVADMNIYDVRKGAPAVIVYLSTHGTLQAFEGTLTHDAGGKRTRRVEVRNDDGDVREAVTADGQDRLEAVRTDTGRHVGTMLDVRLTRPWDVLADHYGLPEGTESLYEVVEVYDTWSEKVVAVEPTREAANQARRDHTPAHDDDDPRGLLVRERGADEEDDDDDDEPSFDYEESDIASIPDVVDALEAGYADEEDDDDDDDDDDARTDGGRPVEDNRRGVAGDPTPDAEYGDVDGDHSGHIPPGETPDHIPSPTAPDRDSPVEWTGDAHLVSTSCAECGASVSVPEGKASEAASGLRAVTCDDCEHDCLDHFGEGRNDPATPDHIIHYTCQACGEWWEFDAEDGTHEVDR